MSLQGPLGQALLARGPQQTATRIPEATFQVIVGPWQSRQVIAVEQAGPVAPTDLVQVSPKRGSGRGQIGSMAHRIEITPELAGNGVGGAR